LSLQAASPETFGYALVWPRRKEILQSDISDAGAQQANYRKKRVVRSKSESNVTRYWISKIKMAAGMEQIEILTKQQTTFHR
jgi:hypothetical protein